MHLGCRAVVVLNGLGKARRRVFPVGVILVYMYKRYRSSVQSACRIRTRTSCSDSPVFHTGKGKLVGLIGCRGDFNLEERERSLARHRVVEELAAVPRMKRSAFSLVPGSHGFLR
jgi:hypothetical protein